MAAEGTTLLDPPPMRVIETERLRLTTLQMSDLDDLAPIYTDPDVMFWSTTGPITTREKAELWLYARATGPGVLQFAVRLRDESPGSTSPGTVIGILGSFHRPKCGYLFRGAYHGKGYATEALRAFTPVYFANVPSARALPGPTDAGGPERAAGSAFDYLEAWTDTENHGSMRVLEKSGFRRGKRFENDWERPGLGWRSSYVFHLPRPGMTCEEVGIGVDGVLGPPGGEEESKIVPPIQ